MTSTEDRVHDLQPLMIASHLGVYAIVTVGSIQNWQDLVDQSFDKRSAHFSEMSGSTTNPTELVATLETCALPNLDFEFERSLGPGEIVRTRVGYAHHVFRRHDCPPGRPAVESRPTDRYEPTLKGRKL